MNVISIPIPKTVDIDAFEVKMLVASKFYEQGKLSAGQASEIAGISKRSFIELLGKYEVSIFSYNFEELEEDLKNV